MTEREDIIIKTSKKKLLLLSLTCAIFIAVGFWIILYSPTEKNPFFDNIYFKYFVGGLSVLVFGALIIYPIIKLFDDKPALVIDKKGIYDNSNAVALGPLHWSEIVAIKETRFFTQKFITVVLDEPQKFIDRQSNKLKKKTLITNLKKNGSPVNISTNSLAISHDELLKLLTDRLKQVKLISVNS
jgi:hypothetical protein